MKSRRFMLARAAIFAGLFVSAGFAVAAEESSSISAPSNQSEVDKLKAQLAQQQTQLEALRTALSDQKAMIESLFANAQPAGGVAGANKPKSLGEVASLAPVVPSSVNVVPHLPLAFQKGDTQAPSPLSLQIGNSYLTPIGFMDFTSVNRTTVSGSGIGTNFGSIPYNNAQGGKLSEFRINPQNSRIGFRFDSKFKDTNVLGYLEADFLGNNAGNVAVTSNSNTLRMRLYFVQLKRDKLEILAGQSWSLLTPGRIGISPIPGDLFYSQDVDVNYQAGLTWSRDPQLRFVYHASKSLAMALSLENAEQYVGGSGGGGIPVPPTALAATEFSQFNNGATTLGAPQLHPDVIAKVAYDALAAGDGHSRFHAEVNGLLSSFKGYNPINNIRYTRTGGGGSINLNLELFPGLRIVTNNYYSQGGGRYLFGTAPDLVILGNGDIGLVRAASTVTGPELTVHKNTLLYAYYGGIYIGRYSTIDPATGKPVGYGYVGSANSQNRTIQEGTFGFNQTMWKDAKYGAVNIMGQYSYLSRAPWYVAALQPKNAHQNMIYFNLRYTLPGSAPKIQ